MSTPDLAPLKRGPYRKPRADLYTVLLLIALVAIILGCVCLWAETRDYGSPPYQGAPQGRSVGGPAPPVVAWELPPGHADLPGNLGALT